jgi:EamA domain-containing membrane protein RarD
VGSCKPFLDIVDEYFEPTRIKTLVVGVLLFKETLRLYDMFAIAMVVGGIMLLQVSG